MAVGTLGRDALARFLRARRAWGRTRGDVHDLLFIARSCEYARARSGLLDLLWVDAEPVVSRRHVASLAGHPEALRVVRTRRLKKEARCA